MTETHTLSGGESLMNQLGYRRSMIPSPDACTMLISGKSGCGKTSFVQSNPKCLHLNLELSSTPGNNPPRSITWPGVNSEGDAVRPHPSGDPEKGEPFIVTYQELLALRDNHLIPMAKENNPNRPRVIAIDTIDELLTLGQQYIVDNQHALWLTSRGYDAKPTFESIGQSAWGALYQQVVRHWILGLRNHGYGVQILAHLTDTRVKKVDGTTENVESHCITSNFHSQLKRRVEVAIKIESNTSFSRKRDESTGKIQSVPVMKVHANTSISTTSDITKSRRKDLPAKIDLPEGRQWQVFEEAYLESVNKERTV